MRDITQVPPEELKQKLDIKQDYRIKQIFQWLWQKDKDSFDDFTNIPQELREKLKEKFYIPKLEVTEIKEDADGTRKIAFTLTDGKIIESVLIPTKNRVTACISSQVGCNVGCKFCATGKMGFIRNLSTGEIVFQVKKLNLLSEKFYGHKLTNIVFMGMGEPLLNYDNVIRASNIITTPDGIGMSPRRITLSTVGITDKIIQMAKEKVKFNLAVSLHSANEIIRSNLIPINKTHNLKKLQRAIFYFYKQTGNRITIGYLLMKNVNDSIEDAKELAKFCKAFPCKINLIEYNPVEGIPYKKPEEVKINTFKALLESKNLIVNIRRSRGKNIDAACGQLATKISKRKKA
jgi:23S rRNA (adenine2503-C2)-methyltransferase